MVRQLASLVTCVALAGCLTSPDQCKASMPSDPATEAFASSLNINLQQMTKTTNGVYEQDDLVGSGATLTTPLPVQVNYLAYLPNGALVDQSSNGPIIIDLRTNGTPGLIDGMLGMNVGGQRTLVVPSDLALGPCGKGPIPPNTTLIYRIELLAINP